MSARESAEAWEKFGEFEGWAMERGCELGPGFQRHRRPSTSPEGSVEGVRLPITCLGVYEDRSLQAVVPHRSGNRTYTVSDYLDVLGDGNAPPVDGSR